MSKAGVSCDICKWPDLTWSNLVTQRVWWRVGDSFNHSPAACKPKVNMDLHFPALSCFSQSPVFSFACKDTDDFIHQKSRTLKQPQLSLEDKETGNKNDVWLQSVLAEIESCQTRKRFWRAHVNCRLSFPSSDGCCCQFTLKFYAFPS